MYRAYRIRLCLFAYRMVHSLDDAEDIVHNVFLKIFEKEDSLNDIVELKPYLYKAVHNACINHLKKSQKISQTSTIEPVTPDGEDYLVKRIEDEVLWELAQAVESLPTKCREVFKLSYMKHMSNDQIATELKISVNTVKSQKQRAKQLLKEQLKDLFVLLMFFLKDF
jgi:RNA polymerase sigma-70 factor (ECF subfamily)